MAGKVTYEELASYCEFLTSTHPANTFGQKPFRDKIYSAALFVMMMVLGKDWLESMASNKNPFFSMEDTYPEGFLKHYLRVVSLAEMLLNFQGTEGFDIIKDQLLKPNPNVFGVFAELETARAIVFLPAPFKFRKPKGNLRDNYDGEIQFPNGIVGCTETKCKVETTALSVPTINEALDRSASQLPLDRPGVIFLRIPQAWLAGSLLAREVHAEWSKTLDATTYEFLSRNSHIVAVEIFALIIWNNKDMASWMSDGRELANPNHKFDRAKDWALMTRTGGGIPDWWVQLFGFFMETGDGIRFDPPKA